LYGDAFHSSFKYCAKKQNIDEKALKLKNAQRFRKLRQHWQPLTLKQFSFKEVREIKTRYMLYLQVVARQQVRPGISDP
jgi:hypothetical protein